MNKSLFLAAQKK